MLDHRYNRDKKLSYTITRLQQPRSAALRARHRRPRAPGCQLDRYTIPRHSVIADLVKPDIISIVMPYLDFKNYEALHVESVNADLVHQGTPSVIAQHLDTVKR